MKKISVPKLIVLAAVCLLALAAHAQSYEFSVLDALPGGSQSTVNAIGNSGIAVGSTYSTTSANNTIATSWSNGAPTALGAGIANAVNDVGQIAGSGVPQPYNDWRASVWAGGSTTQLALTDPNYPYGFPNNEAYGINNHGQVVGSSNPDGSGYPTAVMWVDSNTIQKVNAGTGAYWTPAVYFLPSLGGSQATGQANAINDSGQIVGRSAYAPPTYGQQSASHATLWANVTSGGADTTDLGTLGGSFSEALALNQSGQIVGDSLTADGRRHATLWDHGQIIDLSPSADDTVANAINGHGLIVGQSSGRRTFATLWDGSNLVDLNSLLSPAEQAAGWILASATGINDSGSIVGQADNTITGVITAYELMPVPEPNSWSLFATGLLMLGLASRRKRDFWIS